MELPTRTHPPDPTTVERPRPLAHLGQRPTRHRRTTPDHHRRPRSRPRPAPRRTRSSPRRLAAVGGPQPHRTAPDPGAASSADRARSRSQPVNRPFVTQPRETSSWRPNPASGKLESLAQTTSTGHAPAVYYWRNPRKLACHRCRPASTNRSISGIRLAFQRRATRLEPATHHHPTVKSEEPVWVTNPRRLGRLRPVGSCGA